MGGVLVLALIPMRKTGRDGEEVLGWSNGGGGGAAVSWNGDCMFLFFLFPDVVFAYLRRVFSFFLFRRELERIRYCNSCGEKVAEARASVLRRGSLCNVFKLAGRNL